MERPLVTVICLCYNHERFVREAIESVLNQSYRNLQIIVVDDSSTDSSTTVIRDLLKNHPEITFLPLAENHGNCRAFNKGLALAKGDFIVDFATDDVMLRQRIEDQVALFSTLDRSFGVVFTDALYIDEEGSEFRQHFAYLFRKGLLDSIPTGDVYCDVLSRYFIAAPTMLVRREVFDVLGGYDETLAYEDFDFWVRSSRSFKYAFIGKVLTLIRKSPNSLSSAAYKPGDPQLESTYRVCVKAAGLNRTLPEKEALITRVRYEFRQSVFSENFKEAGLFYSLLISLENPPFRYKFLRFVMKLGLPLSGLRTLYQQIRFR